MKFKEKPVKFKLFNKKITKKGFFMIDNVLDIHDFKKIMKQEKLHRKDLRICVQEKVLNVTQGCGENL